MTEPVNAEEYLDNLIRNHDTERQERRVLAYALGDPFDGMTDGNTTLKL